MGSSTLPHPGITAFPKTSSSSNDPCPNYSAPPLQFQVILTGSPGSIVDLSLPNLGHNLLPTTHLTPKTLFGAADGDREVFGQLCAAQIASYLMILRPEDKRTLVLGLGLSGRQSDREAFFDLFDLVQRVL